MSLRPWIFLKSRTNREIMSWLGGGATVIAAGMWAVFVFLVHHDGKVGGEASAPQVSQSGTGIASGGNTVINAPVNIGVNEQRVGQQFVDAQKPLADKLEKLLALTARDKGVEVAPLRAILVKLGEAGVSDEDIAKRLDQKADELVKLREEIGRLRQGPAELASFAQQAQALIDKGDLDGARKSLAAARAAARKLREQSSRYEADFLVQEARVDHLQLAYRSAAAKYAEAASLVAAVDRQKQWEFMLGQANELYSQGNELGDNAALAEALTVGRGSLLLAPRSERPLDWAMTQNNLGNALATLGERESGTARLEEAIAAFRDALTEYTRERGPLAWATSTGNQGVVLMQVAERRSDTEMARTAFAQIEAAFTAMRDGGHAPHASFYEAQLPYARALVAKLSEVGKRH
jgi:tetratricopeptide (TPR) repeat protein